MSDPVKNAEVEDVLSSIRRLVSEDKRPLQTPRPEVAEAPKADRLVLTPALRVAQEQPEQDAQAIENEADGAEFSQDTPTDELSALLAENVDTAMAEQDEAEPVQALAENYDDDPYNFDDDADHDGEADAALLLTNPAVIPGPDTDQDAQPSQEEPTEQTDETALADEDLSVEAASGDDHTQEDSQEQPALEAENIAEKTLTDKIAALETAIGSISDEWEPDEAGQDAYAGSEAEAMVWEDDVPQEPDAAQAETTEDIKEIEVEASPVDAHERTPAEIDQDDDDDAQVAGFAMTSDDQLLDEETLREMISEIVHRELQGALGERITRNVRRLVRREIHRALTARDLD